MRNAWVLLGGVGVEGGEGDGGGGVAWGCFL